MEALYLMNNMNIPKNVNKIKSTINDCSNSIEVVSKYLNIQKMQNQSLRLEQLKNVQEEGYNLFKNKNKDYGDAFANYGPIGVLIRLGDKIQRLQSISKNEIILVEDEKIRDTLIDLHNYSAMAIMLLDENTKT
jgi:hypothetical protein